MKIVLYIAPIPWHINDVGARDNLKNKERAMAKVNFRKHYIENAETKKRCRVWYSLDNRADQKPCVTLYAKGYGDEMSVIIDFKNDSDLMSDYFDKDRAVIFEGDENYAEARAQAEAIKAARSFSNKAAI